MSVAKNSQCCVETKCMHNQLCLNLGAIFIVVVVAIGVVGVAVYAPIAS